MNRTARTSLALLLACVLPVSASAEDEGDAGGLFAEEEKPAEAVETEAAEPDAQAPEAEAEAEPEEDAEPDPQELAARAAELNRQLREVQGELRQAQAQNRTRRATEGDLADIVLPDNPTRADCEAYVQAIAEATEGQNSFSTGDPQVQMLAQVPPEHVDLLVAATTGRSSLRFHAQYAIRNMDLSVLRDRISILVEEQPAMIGVVVSYGWCRDAAEAIKNKINQRPANLGMAWFQAAAELRDPTLYEAMHDCALQTRYTAQVLQILETLPDYDLQHTVAELWQRSREGNSSSNTYQIATVAVRYGNVDALGELINQLSRRSSYYSNNGENTFDTQRAVVMRYIDYSGSNSEIAEWFAEHKDLLVFDHVAQRYLLPEQVEQF